MPALAQIRRHSRLPEVRGLDPLDYKTIWSRAEAALVEVKERPPQAPRESYAPLAPALG